jgi:hypothetical protein
MYHPCSSPAGQRSCIVQCRTYHLHSSNTGHRSCIARMYYPRSSTAGHRSCIVLVQDMSIERPRTQSPHLSSPASGKAYARDSSALFLHVRGPGGHPLCFFSSSTLEEVGYGILLHSWFLWEAVGLCIFAATDTERFF